MLAAFYSVPASLFRIYGGRLSDRFGARRGACTGRFGVSVAVHLHAVLSADRLRDPRHPRADHLLDLRWAWCRSLVTIFVLGFFMSLGKAAVYKHIPVYYPGHVGAVGGLVGMVGGLGGFILPLLFGVLNDLTGVWTSCFCPAVAPGHRVAALDACRDPADGGGSEWTRSPSRSPNSRRWRRSTTRPDGPGPVTVGEPPAHALADWRPEDPAFWATTGRPIARRNLWISILPAAGLRGLDGVERGGGQAARDRLRLHPRPALLARGTARPVRRHLADLLRLHGADLRRPVVDDRVDRVAC